MVKSGRMVYSRGITRYAKENLPTEEAPTSPTAWVSITAANEERSHRPEAAADEGAPPHRGVTMLSRPHRLSKERDVKRVSSQGRPVFGPNLTIRVLQNRASCLRATVVAGLKVSKRATIRNRVKRLVREALRRHLVSLRPDVDLVIYAKPSAVGKSYRQLAEELGRALDRAHILRGPWGDNGLKT